MTNKEQQKLFEHEQTAKPTGPVECFGRSFESDEARRAYFLEKLKEALGDPKFREIEGFPIGEDEDILSLSDPPYYTACPNPFLSSFIQHHGHTYEPSEPYHREPLAIDVSEGRYAPESLAHSYHTKVPARAVMRYILHYTKPGDIVLDGFCGTGMTAIAAQLCGTLPEDERVAIEKDVPDARWGQRYAIAIDLSPAATFIAANYLNTPAVPDLKARCDDAIAAVRQATGWMFETNVVGAGGQRQAARIDHTAWSDVFQCPNCGAELVLWHLVVGTDGSIDKTAITCPKCSADLKASDLSRVLTATFDAFLGETVRRPKAVPVEISYSKGKRRGKKEPDEQDYAVLEKIQGEGQDSAVPVLKMLFREGAWGDMHRSGYHAGTTHFHHFWTVRNLLGLAALREAVLRPRVVWGSSMLLTATTQKLSRMMRYMSDGIGRIQNGVLYFPALFKETNPTHLLGIAKKQLLRLKDAVSLSPSASIIGTCSATDLSGLPENSIDYVFVDPPFGGNIMYSELNFLWEGWLGVFTRQEPEAVVNKTQKKDFDAYTRLMAGCFSEFYRVLKPGRWITVEFHNSQNSVWNSIQQAITEAGLVVADVRVLDKKQGTFKQVTTAGAVKKDLVISAYKPNQGLEERFKLEAGTEDGVWDFARTHLRQLPVFVSRDGQAEVIAERQNFLLFDRMVAFHVQRGVTVPLSATEFYTGLAQRFSERDGMYFLSEQVAEYDQKRMTVKEVLQLQLFVKDEETAIQWLKQQLTRKPQSFQDIHPVFMREIGGWEKHERSLELAELLDQNFLRYDGTGEVPSQIHSYLSSNFKELRSLEKSDSALRAKAKDRWYVPDPRKAGDLEKLRERALLKEFDEYGESTQKKLKVFRLEAVRAGFRRA